MTDRVRPLAVVLGIAVLSVAGVQNAFAEDQQAISEIRVLVQGTRLAASPGLSTLGSDRLSHLRTTNSDTAELLNAVPGMSVQKAGGVSGLPVLHGLGDDRLRIRVDGMDLISACANHMNPPLSYLAPSAIGSMQVYAGITPVSVGGDSIGGAIVVESPPPVFADPEEGWISSAEVGSYYRSNGDAFGANVAATLANDSFHIGYSGSMARSNNYDAAGSFKPRLLATHTRRGDRWIDGDEVASTAYRSDNHQLRLAYQYGSHLFDLKLVYQHIPYQGFPNQHMDMTDNKSRQINFGYWGSYGWGTLEARLYHEKTTHEMDFLDDKLFWYHTSRTIPGMPMETEGRNLGARVKAEVGLSARDLLRAGAEYQRYRLDDRWPASYGIVNGVPVGGMQPNTFVNINDGKRDRYDLYVEWERMWTPEWITIVGARGSQVRMDSDPVSGYNPSYAVDADRFNRRNRSHTDDNIDVSALVRFTPDLRQTYEMGYSHKMRSPSLYERYTWSTGSMAMTMNNWVNDGNGYVGNVDLRSEKAHTVSISAQWHDAAQSKWNVRFTPYYTRVNRYIDAVCLTTACLDGQYNYLTLANQSARLFGADLSASMVLGNARGIGEFTLSGDVSYIDGKNRRTGDYLYNMMPLNGHIALKHRLKGWTNTLDGEWVTSKNHLSDVRNEIETPGYVLLHWRSSYEWKNVRFDFGIENLLDKHYYLPLGGAYIGQGATMSLGSADAWHAVGAPPWGYAVPGMGRSVYAGVNVKF